MAWLLTMVALSTLVFVGLAGCTDAKPGDPALPEGFQSQGVPDADLNAYVYFNAGSPVTFPLEAIGKVTGTDPGVTGNAQVVTVQGIMRDPQTEEAARVEFADSATAQAVADEAAKAVNGQPNEWIASQQSAVVAGRSGTDWAAALQGAWQGARYAQIDARYPDAWDMMRLLPSDPPNPPVAAGFVRNVSDLLEPVLASQNISVPGLQSALGLVRVNTLAFAVYGKDVSSVPSDITLDTLKEKGLGIVAVTKAGYPGFVVNFLLGQFASKAQLESTTVDGEDVRYRLIDNKVYLMVKNYGATLFMAVAPTQGGAEDLIRAVMKDQASR